MKLETQHIVLRCLIVDDDPVSRKLIGSLVDRTEWLSLVASVGSAEEASQALTDNEIDLILLDVEMPGMSGLELLDSLKKSYDIVLITSKQEYAVDAFDYGVTDYLVKPVAYDRFLKACTKARENLSAQNGTEDYMFVKTGTAYAKITLSEILYIESMGDYVSIHTTDKRYVVNITMKETETKLSSRNFLRVHRSYIVNMEAVGQLEDNAIKIGDKSIPVSRSHKKNLIEKLKLF